MPINAPIKLTYLQARFKVCDRRCPNVVIELSSMEFFLKRNIAMLNCATNRTYKRVKWHRGATFCT